MTDIQLIPGGVTAARGFKAAGLHCGVRRNANKKDLALIFAEVPCAAAVTVTTNRVKAAPLTLTMKHIANGRARAIIANSGNANACTPDGDAHALAICAAAAQSLGVAAEDIIINSTGVIGAPLPVDTILGAVDSLVGALSETGSDDAAAAIMTTDLTEKSIAVTFTLGGVPVTLGGIAKGSGMIHPNMATMMAFLTTDAAIAPALLQKALRESVRVSYNRVSVDGDTSTNDMCAILASGLAGNAEITTEGEDYGRLLAALNHVNGYLAREIARDGEGATKLMTCRVSGAADEDTAEALAKAVIASSLVKTMMFGADANCGRVLCAMGYSGAAFDTSAVGMDFRSDAGCVTVCRDGYVLPFDEAAAKTILQQKEVFIDITLHDGNGKAEAFGCDLSYDYVKINGDYRS